MKIVTLKQLRRLLSNWRRKKLRVVFTNGCFDLLHLGHVRSLQLARKEGDILIVGLNSDSSVRKLKGPGRPLVPGKERAEILSALEAVDYIVFFSQTTPLNLIKAIKPDVLVKGAEYRGKEVAGADLIRKRGGKVVFLPMVKGRSTSRLVARIIQKTVGEKNE
ncbi:MAG: D-glycero-beta-D-manno-heptose 1-phosphate adenylyltransferase [Candidatus Omnitrophica bacterium]|nr:D-glycero-beta-D-manno-heptose 1-phosphate adenylyltransferase [Candidatus Omnitrophota bacterium]